MLTLRDGSKVLVGGAQAVGGKIVLRFLSDGAEVVAVDPGDYVYPSDVRVDAGTSRLYVKATGQAGGIRAETWLYEYDLTRRRRGSRLLVDPAVLPGECPM
jgi:hypothetical protein